MVEITEREEQVFQTDSNTILPYFIKRQIGGYSADLIRLDSLFYYTNEGNLSGKWEIEDKGDNIFLLSNGKFIKVDFVCEKSEIICTLSKQADSPANFENELLKGKYTSKIEDALLPQ